MSSGESVLPAPKAVPHLGVNVLWTLSGYVVYMACQWAMLVVVARLGSPEKVGQFALGLAVSAPVILFTNLGLRRIQVTDASERFHFADYLGLRLLMNALALGTIAAIALASGYGRATALVILAMGFSKTVEATSDVVFGVLQLGERMDLIAGSLFLRGIAGLGGLGLGMALTHSVAVGVVALAAGWTAVLVCYDLPRAARILKLRGAAGGLRPRWSLLPLGRLLWLSLPLGIVATLMSLMSSIPPVLIERFRGTVELGFYTAIAYSYTALHRISSALGEAASARLARHRASGRKDLFVRAFAGLLAVAGSCGAAGFVVAAFAGGPLLAFLYGPEYAAHAGLLTTFMLVAMLSGMVVVCDYAMTALRQLKVQPLVYGASVLLYAVLCYRLIPTLGLGGAVLSLGIVTVFQALTNGLILARALTAFPAAVPASVPAPAGVVAA